MSEDEYFKYCESNPTSYKLKDVIIDVGLVIISISYLIWMVS